MDNGRVLHLADKCTFLEYENRRLKKERRETMQGYTQTQELVDAILTSCALNFGENNADGSRAISIPRTGLLDLVREYRITVEGGEKEYRIVISRREQKNDD
ncbi:MAG: hypothetical protein MJ074_10830 [Oscillospiraceae bacterium]|nr:hypothetical protein [Oscillospiraceae bacterium]